MALEAFFAATRAHFPRCGLLRPANPGNPPPRSAGARGSALLPAAALDPAGGAGVLSGLSYPPERRTALQAGPPLRPCVPYPPALRSAGGGGREARQAGADYGQRLTYSAASAALSVALEHTGNQTDMFPRLTGPLQGPF